MSYGRRFPLVRPNDAVSIHLTKREHVAIQLLQGLLSNPRVNDGRNMAVLAVIHTDELFTALNHEPGDSLPHKGSDV